MQLYLGPEIQKIIIFIDMRLYTYNCYGNSNSVKGVQDKSTWDIVSQNEWWFNDNMTINGFELSRRVSSLLKGLFWRQGHFCFTSQKKNKPFLVGIGPPYRL